MMLIRCLVRVVDQTESLPLHLFDQVMHPTLGEHLKRNVLVCVGGEPPASSLIDDGGDDDEVSHKGVVKCLSPASISVAAAELECNVIMESDVEMEKDVGMEMLPRGLIAPPLRSRGGHEHLTGGVSGLVDRRILLLLGRWFRNFQSWQCSGSVATEQILGDYQINVEPMSGGESETLLSGCNEEYFTFGMIESAESFNRLQSNPTKCEGSVTVNERNCLSSTSGNVGQVRYLSESICY